MEVQNKIPASAPKKRGRKKAATTEPAATTAPAVTAEPAATTEPAATAEPAATTDSAVISNDQSSEWSINPAASPGMLGNAGATGEDDDTLPSIPDENIEKFLNDSDVPGGVVKRTNTSLIPESPSDLVEAPDDSSGPGWYLCTHGCIGSRDFKPRKRYYFEKTPPKTHFVKVKDSEENDG